MRLAHVVWESRQALGHADQKETENTKLIIVRLTIAIVFVLIRWTAWGGEKRLASLDQRRFIRKWTEKKNFRESFVLFFCNSSVWAKVQFSLVQKYLRVEIKISGKCDNEHRLLKRRCVSWRTRLSVRSQFNILSSTFVGVEIGSNKKACYLTFCSNRVNRIRPY